MKIKILYLFIIVSSFRTISAQQLTDFTQYRENAFSYNPALAGSEDQNVVYLTGRKVWTKIQGSPFTANLAFHMPLENEHIGIGGYFFNDNTGPTSFSGLNFSFAYRIILSENQTGVSARKVLSFGLSASAVQYRINGSRIKLDQPVDVAINTYKGSQFYPDASFGVYYESKKVVTGISVPQLLHLDVPVNARQTGEKSTLRKMQHYYAYFVYKFDLNPNRLNNRKHYLEPGANIHYVINAPFQGIASLRYNYDNVFYFELGYRSLSSMLFGAGLTISKQFTINYASDFSLSRTRADLGSVHEISLKFVFDNTTFDRR